MSERIEARLTVSADHPSLPGHFPGQPVVPGVVLLERLIDAAEQSLGSRMRVLGMPQVKFLAPLLPGEEAVAVMELHTQSAPDSSRAAGTTGIAVTAASATNNAVPPNTQPTSSLRFRVERAGQAIAQGTFHVAIGQA